MAPDTTATADPATPPSASAPTGWHVFGVVPADATPPDGVRVVRHRDVAALVAPLRGGAPTRQRLLTHSRLLDDVAGTTAVLPIRFGTVAPTVAAVEQHLLAPQYDHLVAALAPLAGRAEFLLRAGYLPDVVVSEVVADDPRVRRGHRLLHRRTERRPGAAGGAHRGNHAARMRLGEMVARGVTARREQDTTTMVAALAPYAAATTVRPASSLDADRLGDLAFLVDLDRRGEFEAAVEELGRRWHRRARLRLLGPMAAYHFAGELVAAERRP